MGKADAAYNNEGLTDGLQNWEEEPSVPGGAVGGGGRAEGPTGFPETVL